MAKVLECDTLVLFGATNYWEEWRTKIGYPDYEKKKAEKQKDGAKNG
jgi:hypothetical protein